MKKLTSRQREFLQDIRRHPAEQGHSGKWRTRSGDWFVDRTIRALIEKGLVITRICYGPIAELTQAGATWLWENK